MLGERIKELRQALGWNQVELAKKLNITKQTVSNWENENILPSIEMLKNLAKAFNVTTDYLLGLDVDPKLNVSGIPVDVIAHMSQLISDYRAMDSNAKKQKE